MDFGLKGKVAFVAASSQGLGKAVAMELATEGAHVIICGRDEDKLNAAGLEIEKLGAGKVVAIQGDLSSKKEQPETSETPFIFYSKNEKVKG